MGLLSYLDRKITRLSYTVEEVREVLSHFLSRSNYRMGLYQYTMNDGWERGYKRPFLKTRYLLLHTRDTARVLRCALTTHKWRDTSHAGPDSGDMSGYCLRCGQSFHHQLY